MRGRPGRAITPCGEGRLTPANAGTTARSRCSVRPDEAHPRECGDDVDLALRLVQDEGSPPRMRGRLYSPGRGWFGDRLTPANAGTTRYRPSRAWQKGAHPRECGDDAATLFLSIYRSGSPPRMRGRRAPHRGRRPRPAGSPPRMRGRPGQAPAGVFGRGLTPANAGTTSKRNR